ncbi:MAG: hypothetical protein VKJ06_03835 [Vampirovibrionales bacterium]|nr:hypothetical protein [Vampirovibrionales bacterium]
MTHPTQFSGASAQQTRARQNLQALVAGAALIALVLLLGSELVTLGTIGANGLAAQPTPEATGATWVETAGARA